MWSSSVTQHCHTPAITPPHPHPPPPPAPPPPPNPQHSHISSILKQKQSHPFLQSIPLCRKGPITGIRNTHMQGEKKPTPQTSLWPDSQRKSKCKSHHPTPFFCPSVTQFTEPLIIQPLLHPPTHDPFPMVAPPFSTKLMVALGTPLPPTPKLPHIPKMASVPCLHPQAQHLRFRFSWENNNTNNNNTPKTCC